MRCSLNLPLGTLRPHGIAIRCTGLPLHLCASRRALLLRLLGLLLLHRTCGTASKQKGDVCCPAAMAFSGTRDGDGGDGDWVMTMQELVVDSNQPIDYTAYPMEVRRRI